MYKQMVTVLFLGILTWVSAGCAQKTACVEASVFDLEDAASSVRDRAPGVAGIIALASGQFDEAIVHRKASNNLADYPTRIAYVRIYVPDGYDSKMPYPKAMVDDISSDRLEFTMVFIGVSDDRVGLVTHYDPPQELTRNIAAGVLWLTSTSRYVVEVSREHLAWALEKQDKKRGYSNLVRSLTGPPHGFTGAEGESDDGSSIHCFGVHSNGRTRWSICVNLRSPSRLHFEPETPMERRLDALEQLVLAVWYVALN